MIAVGMSLLPVTLEEETAPMQTPPIQQVATIAAPCLRHYERAKAMNG